MILNERNIMKSSFKEITVTLGTRMEGGFYAGRILIDDQPFALFVASKSEGERDEAIWIKGHENIPGAMSYCDGMANTKAMAETSSELAQWALNLRIGGFDDWYLPSQDELEIIYRNLKPSTEANCSYSRSGINLSAITPTRPYTPKFPLQTQTEAFQLGGEQAFEEDWYWSSTQHSSNSISAWNQIFGNGYQSSLNKSSKFRARAVRRLPI